MPSTNSAGRPSITYTDTVVNDNQKPYLHQQLMHIEVTAYGNHKDIVYRKEDSHTINISWSNEGGIPDSSYSTQTGSTFKSNKKILNLLVITFYIIIGSRMDNNIDRNY